MRILIATDGSEFSREAIKKICQMLIDPENTEIKIVTVYQTIIPLDNFSQTAEYIEKLERIERAEAESNIENAVSEINNYLPDSTIKIEKEIKIGPPDQAILETAKEWKPDLIVVGTHGRGFWGRLTLGSISNSVVHHAPCSVFVVRKTNVTE